MIVTTTIIPYKIDGDGQLINSFEYATMNSDGITPHNSEYTFPLVDCSITIITWHAHYTVDFWDHYYRHVGLEAYWNKNPGSTSTINFTNMNIDFDSAGDLYPYPTVVEDRPSNWQDYLIAQNHVTSTPIYQANPVEGTHYYGTGGMPYNRVIYLRDYFLHLGLVSYDLKYKVNNSNKSYYGQYVVFSK